MRKLEVSALRRLPERMGAVVSAADILSHLEGVRDSRTGWLARCPGPLHEHGDRHASLALARGKHDDRWLIHCYAGCLPIDIMRALGLELADLYDDRVYRPRGDSEKPRLSAGERLEVLEHELGVALMIASDFLREQTISKENTVRLAQAVARIGAARHG